MTNRRLRHLDRERGDGKNHMAVGMMRGVVGWKGEDGWSGGSGRKVALELRRKVGGGRLWFSPALSGRKKGGGFGAQRFVWRDLGGGGSLGSGHDGVESGFKGDGKGQG